MASEVSSLVKSKVMKMMITEIKIIVIMMIKMTTMINIIVIMMIRIITMINIIVIIMIKMTMVINIIVIMLMLTAVGRQAGDQVSRSTDSWNLKNINIIIN